MERSRVETRPTNGPIFFPLVNPNRVLVNLGNVKDLLQLLTCRQIKLSLEMLNSAGRILSGFNGATTVTLGDVALLVTAGLVTQNFCSQRFNALQCHSALQTWLHSMKVVPSTYHQTVSYLTNAGQVDLFSKHLAAR